MPSKLTLPSVPRYIPAEVTRCDLDYADLPIIDFAKASTGEGRAKLAAELRGALKEHGFFYVVNHGYTPAQTQRIFDIANVPFDGVPEEEKREYVAKMQETGSFHGYKPRRYWHIGGGVQDQIEHYAINRDVNKVEHPLALRPLLPEIDEFARHNHFNVLHPILRLIALGLELPEENLVDLHKWDGVGDTYVRFMKYFPHTEEEEERSNNVWLTGHTDIGSITILHSQPVSALQILTSDGSWKWIKHIENALVINAGDVLEFLSGGYFKATIHRVRQPPEDQRGHDRLGVFYFSMPDDNVKLLPLVSSRVVQALGVKRRFPDEEAPTMEQWRKGRTAAGGKTELKETEEKNVQEEVINGVAVKYYH